MGGSRRHYERICMSVPSHGSDAADHDLFVMSLPEARLIVRDPSRHVATKENFIHMVRASHTICESPDATLDDLLACASSPFGSANWRPTHLLHERTGVPKRLDEFGFIIRDPEFWRDYLVCFLPQPPNDDTGDA